MVTMEFEIIADVKKTAQITEKFYKRGADWVNALPKKEKERVLNDFWEGAVPNVIHGKEVILPENQEELLGWFVITIDAVNDGHDMMEKQKEEIGAPDQGFLNVITAVREISGLIGERLGIVRQVPEKGAARRGVNG